MESHGSLRHCYSWSRDTKLEGKVWVRYILRWLHDEDTAEIRGLHKDRLINKAEWVNFAIDLVQKYFNGNLKVYPQTWELELPCTASDTAW